MRAAFSSCPSLISSRHAESVTGHDAGKPDRLPIARPRYFRGAGAGTRRRHSSAPLRPCFRRPVRTWAKPCRDVQRSGSRSRRRTGSSSTSRSRPIAFAACGAGGVAITPSFQDGHLASRPRRPEPARTRSSIEFVAGDEALNRDREFLYTLFVPARAHRAFPCFDQPDLKARYTLVARRARRGGRRWPTGRPNGDRTLRGERVASGSPRPSRCRPICSRSWPGNSRWRRRSANGREFRMFHRETDAAKVARNRDAIFDLHATALAWLEDYTAIPYPFGKFDFVAIPSFQFGGMEHAGAILYNAAGLLLDESATQNQLLDRANLIAHETSHMWFGDLVTMQLVQRRLDEGGVRELHGGEDREPVVPAGEPRPEIPAGELPGGVRGRSDCRLEPDPAAAGEPRGGRAVVRADHLPEGADHDAAARAVVGERRSATACAST